MDTRKIHKIILKATGADECFHINDIQSLWSGYGQIVRYGLKGNDCKSVVVKHVKLPDKRNHPRGWDTDLSHQRKVKSYQVEGAWYRNWSHFCDNSCRIPNCLALEASEDECVMVLEDLDAAGFPIRKNSLSVEELNVCLSWLANFHATFMEQAPAGLWKVGTYWHLDTRPDELAVLEDIELKHAAAKIDAQLNSARFKTFVHGDAKLANFCFSDTRNSNAGMQVAAVDFQYVGGGCGMKDVAYFIGSCLNEDECERYESVLLNNYFTALRSALKSRHSTLNLDALEHEWRSLFPVAWTDFHRFVKGWSPGHWKIHGYSERLARNVIATLNGEHY